MEEESMYNLSLGNNIDIMESMKNNGIKVDLTVTSPPYDNLRNYEGSLQWNENIWKKIIKGLYDITTDGGTVVWVVGDATVNGSETGTSFKQALYFMEQGFNLHDTMIYEKNSFSNPSSNRYHQVFEYMFVFTKGKIKTFNPLMDKKNNYAGTTSWGKNTSRNIDGELKENKQRKPIKEYGMRYNIWKYNVGKGFTTKDDAYEHPAMFPESLAEDHILSWSNEGDVVFDPFSGSGTTGKMAILNGRKYIGAEIVEKYYKLSDKRLKEAEKKWNLQKDLKEDW